MKSIPTLDREIAEQVIGDRLDAVGFARVVAERYPDGFALDTTPGAWTTAELTKLKAVMHESLSVMPSMPPTPGATFVRGVVEEYLAGRLTPDQAAQQLYDSEIAPGLTWSGDSPDESDKIMLLVHHLSTLAVKRGPSRSESA